MARGRHPRKPVEDALAEAEAAGWEVRRIASGHRWGLMLCGEASRNGCRASIWSTPRSPERHASQLRRVLGRCAHEWGDD